MPSFKVMLWAIWIELLLIPTLPVVAAVVNRRSSRFLRYPWMDRLEVLLSYILLVNFTLLGMMVHGIHNIWLDNLAILPEVALSLWVLAALGPRSLPRWASGAAFLITLGCVVWDATTNGIKEKWLTATAAYSLILFLLVIWRLWELFLRIGTRPAHSEPGFWLLSAWAINLGNILFYTPFSALFLKHLSRTWILVPGLVFNLFGVIFSLALSRTFLCRNQPSF